MKTPWKRTLGIILSTGLFIMPPGANATLGEEHETMAVIGTAAHDNQGQEDSGTGRPPDLGIVLTADGADSPPADSQSTESATAGSSGGVADKATQTDDPGVEEHKTMSGTDKNRQAGDADKHDKADTTGSDEEDNEKININTASEDELVEGLKGIGPSKAREIIKYREKHGPFKKIDQLKKVKGIGPSTYGEIKSQLEL